MCTLSKTTEEREYFDTVFGWDNVGDELNLNYLIVESRSPARSAEAVHKDFERFAAC